MWKRATAHPERSRNQAMPYDEGLADRIRGALGPNAEVTERKDVLRNCEGRVDGASRPRALRGVAREGSRPPDGFHGACHERLRLCRGIRMSDDESRQVLGRIGRRIRCDT